MGSASQEGGGLSSEGKDWPLIFSIKQGPQILGPWSGYLPTTAWEKLSSWVSIRKQHQCWNNLKLWGDWFYHVAMKFCWVLMRCDDPCRDARGCSWKVAPTHLLVGVLIHGGTRTHSYTRALLSVSHVRSVKSGDEIASALFLAMLPFCTFGLLKWSLEEFGQNFLKKVWYTLFILM